MNRPWKEYCIGESKDPQVKNRLVRLKIFKPEFEKPKLDEWRFFVLSASELADLRKGELDLNTEGWAFLIHCGIKTSFYYDMDSKNTFFDGILRYRSFHVAEQKAMTLLKKKFSQDNFRYPTLEDRQRVVAERLKRYK
ncbi:MAG: hypothetical protein M0021_16710 [Clostridia bacterium]|nr:hypothetical protein [Clostridia bacterium]